MTFDEKKIQINPIIESASIGSVSEEITDSILEKKEEDK